MRFASQAFYFALIVSTTSLLGFVREIIIARDFGLSLEMDCFISAFAIVSFIAAIFNPQTLQSMFMPAYRDAQRSGARNASILSNNMLLILSLLLLFITVMLYLGSPVIVRLVLPGFTAEKMLLTTQLITIMLPIILSAGLISLTHAVSNSHQQFLYPVFTQTINNALVILLLQMIPAQAVTTLAHYYVYGNLLTCLMCAGAYIRFTASAQIKLRHRQYLDNMSLTWPLLIVALMDQAAIFLPRSFASTLQHGDISALSYAYRLITLPVSIIAAAIVSVLFPRIIAHVRDQPEKALSTLRLVSNILLYCLLPITIFTYSKSHAIVALLFSSERFTQGAVDHTASALMFYSLTILGLGYNLFLNRVYAAYGAYWTYVKYCIVGCISLCGLILLFITPMQHNGIAIAFSLSSCGLSAALYLRLQHFGLRRVISYRSVLSLTLASITMVSLLATIPVHSFAMLCASAVLSMAGFYCLLWILGDVAFKNIINELKNK